MKKQVKIIGCGVSGLTTGVLLLETGYTVEIITDKLPQETTSSKAAAVWFPYEVNPRDKAEKWGKVSFNRFLEFCSDKDSGVSMVPLTVLIEKEEDAWWINALPIGEMRKGSKAELPEAFPLGYMMEVPLVETQLYLDFLLARFKDLSGRVKQRKVGKLSEFTDSNTIVVNCTGLGSRELMHDDELYPIHGQIIKAKPQPKVTCILADFPFGETRDRLAYVVPRKDCLVLGGTSIKGEEDDTPNPGLIEGIIERCKAIEGNIEELDSQSVEGGLRPGRVEIRLERDGNIIHNYGHGGGGFTVSWGCAEEVYKLIKTMD